MTDFTELHDELRAVARDLLAKTERPDWRRLVDAGWPGLEVPEDLDGAGATFAEVAVVLEELGRAATPSPFLGTAVLGVGALNLLAPNPGRDVLLRLIATGDRLVAVALIDGDAHSSDQNDGLGSVAFRVERTEGGWQLHGKAEFVVDAPDADRLLVVANDPDGALVVVVLHADAAVSGLTVADQPVLDATRSLGAVVAEGVEVDDAAVWRFARDPVAAVQSLYDRATLAVAVDSLGLAESMLAATVAYAGERQQFGRPIGSFQAVKHACADMLVQVTVGRELVRAALVDLDPVAVSRAKSHVCSAAVDVVGKALQLHGGIGYTWESGVHVYLKRATLNRSLYGSPTAHRRRVATRLVPPGCTARDTSVSLK